ncbi:MAG TPA: polysaccharide deacetylase [Kiloniellales bacterium]
MTLIQNPCPWPNGARCAVAYTFDLDADSTIHLNTPDIAHTRVCASSMMRYGPTIAIPRLVKVMRRYELRQTFFVPGWCVEKYPRAIELLLENGHEIAHHGYLHEKPNILSEDEQLEALQRGVEAIVKATGARPLGYRAPSYAFSDHTLHQLVSEGFAYESSLLGDDVPYVVRSGNGELIELPVDYSMDDWNQYMCFKELGYMLPVASPKRAMELFRAEFDSAHRNGGMWITVWHPFVSGRLARCEAMIELIEYMMEKGDVWFATTAEIAAHARACMDDGSWTPRVDKLPYYDKPAA